MIDVFELIQPASPTRTTVDLNGETGTGKEQVARGDSPGVDATPHRAVRRGELRARNRRKLAGKRTLRRTRRARTPAPTASAIGRFELAACTGTLFLDEIGDVPMSMQIGCSACCRSGGSAVGGTEPIDVDVRVIAATHQDMEKLVKEGKFRADLYYRLNVVASTCLRLREPHGGHSRTGRALLRKIRPPNQKPATVQCADAAGPHDEVPVAGNVRQLENAVERACVTARDGVIRVKGLTAGRGPHAPRRAKNPFRVDLKRRLPRSVGGVGGLLREAHTSFARAQPRARNVGSARDYRAVRRSITDKISQYEIDKKEFRAEGKKQSEPRIGQSRQRSRR